MDSTILIFDVEFCKMEIRLIFFKEIVGLISLKTELKYQYPMHLPAREEKSTRRFFLPKVSLISILQKFSFDLLIFPLCMTWPIRLSPSAAPAEGCDPSSASPVPKPLRRVFSGAGWAAQGPHKTNGIVRGAVRIDDELSVEALLYLFYAPHSYTGETLAELHVHVGPAVVEALVQRLLADGLRPAGPGEFTARAYLNGKIDLAQAEAVNEVVSSSNRFQLDAAEKLLSGRLSGAVGEIRTALLDCMSLIEAGAAGRDSPAA